MASLYTVSVENVKSVAQKNGTQAARYADIRKYMESAEKQSNAVDKKLRLCKKMLAIQTPSGYNKHQRKCSGFYFFHLLIYFSMRYSRIFPDSHLMIYLTLARSEVFGALQHTWMLTQRRMEQADCPLSISGNQLSSNHTAGIFSKNWPVIIYHTHQKE